ncbi:MAG: methyltransferase [Candidatus Magasanikbacteria bacterium]|nr:methyltransferase [Candidatus Magasanikbacteria bacterium]
MLKKLFNIYRFLFPKSKVIFNDLQRIYPISTMFGFDRGTPIDRYYIENFLSANSKFITGKVLEIGDNIYTLKYGNKNVKSEVLGFDKTSPNVTIIGDLTKMETLPNKEIDCFICTQTYNFIYDVKKAIKGSYYILKEKGTLLGTVSGISQISRYDMDKWGDYWRFTDKSIRILLEEAGFKNINVYPMGNVLASIAFLQGVVIEDMPKKQLLNKHDKDYQLTICFTAIK